MEGVDNDAPSSSSSSFPSLNELLQQQTKCKNASGPNKLLEIMSLDVQRVRGTMKSYISRNANLEELVQLLKEDNKAKKQEVESWKHKYQGLQVRKCLLGYFFTTACIYPCISLID